MRVSNKINVLWTKRAGFSWKPDGTLIDGAGSAVEFSIVTSASNSQRTQMATMIQADLKELGIRGSGRAIGIPRRSGSDFPNP